MTDSNGKLVDTLYSPLYKKEFFQAAGLPIGKDWSADKSMYHTPDDTEGDKGGDDGLDNEIITVDLTKVNPAIDQIFFFLNIYQPRNIDFQKIPYVAIRMYEGTPKKVKSIFAQYDVAKENQFMGKNALIMGKLYRRNGDWKFAAIGDAFDDQNDLRQTVKRILTSYSKQSNEKITSLFVIGYIRLYVRRTDRGGQNGVQTLISTLRGDPYALETAYISIITFNSVAQQVTPLTELSAFQQPQIEASGCTALGEALTLLAQKVDTEIVKTTQEVKGDWKPLVFLMTDGEPTDDLQKGIDEFKKRKFGMVVACAAGQGANTNTLKQITENVVQLDTADSATIKAFFKWVSASISTGSQKVEDTHGDVASMSELPPPPPEVNIVV